MIKGPKNAIPTTKGWVHLKTNELLKCQKITQAQIDEWYGVTAPEPVVVEEIIEEIVEVEPEPEVVAPKKKRQYNIFKK